MDLTAEHDVPRRELLVRAIFTEVQLRSVAFGVEQMIANSLATALYPEALEFVRNHIDYRKIADATQAAVLANIQQTIVNAPDSGYESDNIEDPGYTRKRRR